MHKDKSPHKPYKKFHLLLDAAFAKPKAFPKLSKKANLAHIVHDFGFSPQAEDQEIYQKAVLEKRIVLTINFKHFKRLIKKGKSGVIAIESQLSNAEIDKIVTEFIVNKNPEHFIGKAIKI